MSIDFDKFLYWAESRFDDVKVRGNEILLNSIFCDDRKHHLWCNPSGGKNGFEGGVYHCWKSEKSGSLVKLVMEVDKCPYDEATEILGASYVGTLEDLGRRVDELFQKSEAVAEEKEPVSSLAMPESCYRFSDLPTSNETARVAYEYLKSRMIDESDLFVCTKGRYRNRIVIPYYDRAGSLIYYNGRYVGDPGSNLRYLGPPKELGIGKGDVLFVPKWPAEGEKIYITEGEFDALSLRQAGFYSAALGGKSMSDRQAEMLGPYLPVLCLDADEHGGKATVSIAKSLLSSGTKKIRYVRPCLEHKDWNGLLVSKGPRILFKYVQMQEKEYNSSIGAGDWEATKLGMNGIIG